VAGFKEYKVPKACRVLQYRAQLVLEFQYREVKEFWDARVFKDFKVVDSRGKLDHREQVAVVVVAQ
jgi:hypothetical protein